MILEKGSSEEEMEFLRAFLGRQPNIYALQAELEKGWDSLSSAKVGQLA
jgi:Zn-dependent oligopeptidase